MRPAAEQHLASAAAFIAVAESGDAKQAAYRRAAEEIEAAKQTDPTLSNVEIGRRLGKSYNYPKALLDALSRARAGDEFRIDWGNAGRDRDEVGANLVARDKPDRFVAAYRQAPPDAQRQIARQIAADPFIEQEVTRHAAAERKRQTEHAARRRDSEAAPLPAYMSRMVVKINEWAAGLASIEPDLDSLPEGRGRDMVLDVLRELVRQATRCIQRLSDEPADNVIEGRVA